MKLINKIYSRISVLVKCKHQSHRGNFSGKNCLQSWNLHYDCFVVVTRYSVSANPVVWVYFNDWMMAKWAQQIITCHCSPARTKSSTTTTSAICMHEDFHVWMDRGFRYTTTIALSQRLFSGSSLEWIQLPSIQLWIY